MKRIKKILKAVKDLFAAIAEEIDLIQRYDLIYRQYSGRKDDNNEK